MITSTANTQVKHVINLLSKSRYRRENRQFVVEGARMVYETPADMLVRVYMSESFYSCHNDGDNRIQLDDDRIVTVSDNVFKQMSDTSTPQGILAVVRMKEYSLSDILKGDNTFVIVCEDIQDPGNLGTILRTGEGAGISGVIMSRNTVDIYNPKTIRSTMGSVYRVPFIYADNLSETIGQMKLTGVKVYAAHLNGNNSYAKEDYRGKSAFMIGNEGNGLTDAVTALADTLIRIPMEGSVESLNAAISSAIVMYEVKRQRDEM